MIATTNLYALEFWAAAHIAAGDAMLAPCGMTVNDIDAVLTVSPEQRQAWAEAEQQALVVPRAGLLPLLAAGNELQIRRTIRPWQGSGELDQLASALNLHLLTVWRAAQGDVLLCDRLGLAETDRTVLRTVNEVLLLRWSQLGVALGVPRPEVLPRLFTAAEPAFAAFVRSLSA